MEEEESFEVFEGEIQEKTEGEIQAAVLTDEEKSIAKSLSESGIRFIEISGDSLKFSANPKFITSRRQPPGSRGVFLPRSEVRELRSQLEEGIQPHPEILGIAIPSLGYLEILTQVNGLYATSLSNAISGLSPEGVPDCRHSNGEVTLPRCDLGPRAARAVLHIQGTASAPCLELSSVSPAALLWITPGRARPNIATFNTPYSLKLHFPSPLDQQSMEDQAREITSSFFYELDVRNGVRLRTVRWPSNNRNQGLAREDLDSFARYPETRVNAEMSTLFGFAGSVLENPPLSFLSYYQVLEFYFPAAVKRTALRQLGKELSDPRFSRSDREDLLRVLKIGERSLNATESSQLRTLITECVRHERIEDFFQKGGWGDHFAKGGPIQGVGIVNPKNTQTPLATQVADRIYKIRNRIVHAKDDPRFEDVPALLPQSEEADALGPDIALARLLASEVIVDSQAS
ncbi:hypothetical protein [Streptomyces prunicolor]|uniref:hypothetical protein n=1 Tax=Streptomyces prunicolor TaxID=67348 RepID=UPI00131A1575|nr:hypothetical protein [Streptomyces prunicolor]